MAGSSKNKKTRCKSKKTYSTRNIIVGVLAFVAFVYSYVINYLHTDGYDIVHRYIASQASLEVLHVNLLVLFTLAYSKASQASRINSRTYLWCVGGVVTTINMFTHALCMNFENLKHLYKGCFRTEWAAGILLVLLLVIIIRMSCLPEEDEYQREIIQ